MNLYQQMRISAMVLQSETVQSWAQKNQWFSRLLVGRPKFNKNDWQLGAGYQLARREICHRIRRADGYGFRQGPFIKYNFLPSGILILFFRYLLTSGDFGDV